MATFEVKGPDGGTYQIDAPDENAALGAFNSLHHGTISVRPWNEAPTEDVTPTNLARSAVRGIPVVGGLVNKLEAATEAGLAPLIEPYLTPGPNTLTTEPNFSGRYEKALRLQNQKDVGFDASHPYVSGGAKFAGGAAALAPVIAAAPAAFGADAAMSVPAAMTAGAGSGAALGAADAATRGEDIGQGAMFGAGGGAAGPLIGRAIGKLIPAAKSAVPSTDDLYQSAQQGFDAARNSGVELKPQAVKQFADKLLTDLHGDGLRDYLAPKTFSALKEMANPPQGGVATFADLHGMRRVLGTAAASPDPTERMAATRAIRGLDDYLGSVPPSDLIAGSSSMDAANSAFKNALGDYAAAKRSDLLQGKVQQAELQAATANSGANLDNALRQRIKDILKSDKLRRGFSQDEILQMQKIARGTAPANVIRTMGNLLGGGGGLGAVASGYAGLQTAGPPGLLAPAAGYAAKKIGNAMTQSEVAKLDEMVRSRAPSAAISLLQNQAAKATTAARKAQLEKLIQTLALASNPVRTLPPSVPASPMPIQ